MQAKTITITSKNQITLPIEYVRMMRLSQQKTLRAELRGKTLLLKPQQTLGNTMRQFWNKHHATRPATDDELQQATRKQAITRIEKSL